MKDNKKSNVKASGLKSVIHLGNAKMVMANFEIDKPLEYDINASKLSERADRQRAFCAKEQQKKKSTIYTIKSNRTPPKENNGQRTNGEWHNTVDSPDPLIPHPAICAKIFKNSDKIKDNLHIQVAQQILDFKKLFAVYANHLEHIFDNFGGISKNSKTYAERDWLSNDFIKKNDNVLNEFKNYRKNAAPYLIYFGIKYTPLQDITDNTKFNDELYVIISAVGMLRNATTHIEKGDSTKNVSPDYILKPDTIPAQIMAKMKCTLCKKLEGINKDFTDRNNKTLQILHLCNLGDNAQEFYNFTMRQDYKNLGFSIRILREKILEKSQIVIKDNPTEKSRINKVLDFIIWQKLEGKKKEYQDILRAEPKGDDKDNPYDRLYTQWANELDLRAEIGKITTAIQKITSNQFVGNEAITKPAELLTIADFSEFSIYVYYLCQFLGGHEINDLLTGLIHKFENVSSFKNIWKKATDNDLDFTDDYKLFKNSENLLKELRRLNGFVRMRTMDKKAKLNNKTDPTFGSAHYHHLAQVLGTKKNKDELTKQINEMSYELDKNGEPVKDDKGNRKKKNLSESALGNFIASNALNNKNFQYLVKYANVASVRKFAQQNIFEFALSQIPVKQMQKYYPDFGDVAKPDDTKIQQTQKEIKELEKKGKNNKKLETLRANLDAMQNPSAQQQARIKAIAQELVAFDWDKYTDKNAQHQIRRQASQKSGHCKTSAVFYNAVSNSKKSCKYKFAVCYGFVAIGL